jgi:hypothetical protein
MNRAERRRNARNDKPKTYVLTDDQITKLKQDAASEATRKAFLMFMSIPVMVLNDKFSFDKQQLDTFMDYSLIWFDSVQSNETPLVELVNIAEKECGIKVLRKEN